MVRRVSLWLSYGLIVVGVALLLGTGVLYGYSHYEEAEAFRAAAQIMPTLRSTPTSESTSTITALSSLRPASSAEASFRSDPDADFIPWRLRHAAIAMPPITPTVRPIFPTERIVAPAIGLDAKVVESRIVDGEWVVPKFVAGHLQGTAQPLQDGNIALAGHVQSISSGNVFANIGRLRPGNEVKLYTKAGIVTYNVEKVRTVKNTDLSVVAPTSEERLTLITCTGTWLPLQRDFSERSVVIATRVQGI